MLNLYQIHITVPLKDDEGIKLLIDSDENIYWLDKESSNPYNTFMEGDYLEYLAGTLQNALDADLYHFSFGLMDLSQAYCFGNEDYRNGICNGMLPETKTTLQEFFCESAYQGYSDLITGLIETIQCKEKSDTLTDIDMDIEDMDSESALSLEDATKILEKIDKSINSQELQQKYFSPMMEYISNEFDTISFEIALSDILGIWNPSNQEIYEYFELYDEPALNYIRDTLLSEKNNKNILFNETITKKELKTQLEAHGYSSSDQNINRLLYGYQKLHNHKDSIFDYYLSNPSYNPLNLK